MRKTAFVPCEYNPFHEGHAKQMEILRNEMGFERIVSIMSGPFVQRGEPGVYPVYERSRAAVEGGSDLVIMMPYAYCAQTAETFAWGAVSCAFACGAEYLCFGTEDPQRKDDLAEAAEFLESEDILSLISSRAKGSIPWPEARIQLLEEKTGKDMGLLRKPNNILALEYMRAIKRIGGSIEPVAVRRIEGLPSASDIRKGLIRKGADGIRTLDEYIPVLKYLITMNDADYISGICGYFSGLSPRLRSALPFLSEGTDRFISEVNTATVPSARIRRFLVNLMMGYTSSDAEKLASHRPGYARVLAIGEKGAEILKELSGRGDIYIVTKPSAASKEGVLGETDRRLFETDNRAFDLYSLGEGRTGDGMRYTPFVKK